MTWFVGQSLVIIAAAFVLGVGVGWLIWGARRAATTSARPSAAAAEHAPAVEAPSETVPAETVPAETVPAETVPAEKGPVTTAAPQAEAETPSTKAASQKPASTKAASKKVRSTKEKELAEDDLDRIEGIGPRMSGALKQAGIRTYRQLAEADEAALREAIEAAGLKFAPSLVTWSRQARLLADGDEEGFADLTRRLVAGRDEARP